MKRVGRNINFYLKRAVLNFIREYVGSEEERTFLESNQFEISYLDYDWRLNELTDKNLSAF